MPTLNSSQANLIAACTTPTASDVDPNANTLGGQCGEHWSSGVLSGGCRVMSMPRSHTAASTPPVSHRNCASRREDSRPVGCASNRYANSTGATLAAATPMLNSTRLLEPLSSHSAEMKPAPINRPPIRAWISLVRAYRPAPISATMIATRSTTAVPGGDASGFFAVVAATPAAANAPRTATPDRRQDVGTASTSLRADPPTRSRNRPAEPKLEWLAASGELTGSRTTGV